MVRGDSKRTMSRDPMKERGYFSTLRSRQPCCVKGPATVVEQTSAQAQRYESRLPLMRENVNGTQTIRRRHGRGLPLVHLSVLFSTDCSMCANRHKSATEKSRPVRLE